jgi:hypothetical protein
MMPVRAAMSSVPTWELALAVEEIMIASTYVVVRIAAGVYEGAVLLAGSSRDVRLGPLSD